MKPLIKLTACYNNADGGYAPTKRANIHGRINHKASKHAHQHIESMWYRNETLTKDAKVINYECRCIERGVKPFHYTDEEFDQVLAEIADDEWCAERDAKFQMDYIY